MIFPQGVYDCARFERKPLVQQLTSDVSAPLQARIVTLFGAATAMSRHPDEVPEIAAQSDALLINLGMPTPDSPALFRSALEVFTEHRKPIVLDVVGCGFTKVRSELARSLTSEFSFGVVRGNAGEIASLAGMRAAQRGMDGSAAREVALASVRDLSGKFAGVVVATGKIDCVADRGEVIYEAGGAGEQLARYSGLGCALGSLMALLCAFHEPARVAVAALSLFKDAAAYAGEVCEMSRAPELSAGTYWVRFWDALSRFACASVSS